MRQFIFLVFVALFTLAFTINYSKVVDAGTETPFGGKHILTLGSETCDCGGNAHMIWDYRTNAMINLYKAPSSIFYDYDNADGTYQLGTYTTSASEDCDMYIYNECYTIVYNDGDYGSQPGTGTTLY